MIPDLRNPLEVVSFYRIITLKLNKPTRMIFCFNHSMVLKFPAGLSANLRFIIYAVAKCRPEVKRLKKSTAAELGLSIEELDRRLAKEIKQLATEQESINIDGI